MIDHILRILTTLGAMGMMFVLGYTYAGKPLSDVSVLMALSLGVGLAASVVAVFRADGAWVIPGKSTH